MDAKRQADGYPSRWIELIWREHADIIYKLCESKCESREDAEDLFQTVALKFCQNAMSLWNRDDVMPWFLTVLRNARCDMVTERHSTYAVSQLNGCVDDIGSLSEECSVFHKFKVESHDDYSALFSVLSPLEKLIVEMSYIGGFLSAEISSIVGISENAVRKRRHFAIKKMKKVLFPGK
jgi:RNA polymerase sigma-70 factor (ECF subfamily)